MIDTEREREREREKLIKGLGEAKLLDVASE